MSCKFSNVLAHFNPRSPHGERPHAGNVEQALDNISIHAPRTGSDSLSLIPRWTLAHFNPRSPHGERPPPRTRRRWACCYFNPRSPHGERLLLYDNIPGGIGHFNPRSPHGERRQRFKCSLDGQRISIHAPRTGSDVWHCRLLRVIIRFQSTLPARGATLNGRAHRVKRVTFQSTLPARGATSAPKADAQSVQISIHAPRTGSDSQTRKGN